MEVFFGVDLLAPERLRPVRASLHHVAACLFFFSSLASARCRGVQYRIAKREGLMNAKLLEKFQELVKRLAEGKDEEVEIDYDDFPVGMQRQGLHSFFLASPLPRYISFCLLSFRQDAKNAKPLRSRVLLSRSSSLS